MEAVILIGVMLKLGGASMTPHYRLHPEAFVLPFLAVASVTSYYAHFRHSKLNTTACMLAVVALMIAANCYRALVLLEEAEMHNNFFPPRGVALSSQCVLAALLLVSAASVLALGRRHWRRREVGEEQ